MRAFYHAPLCVPGVPPFLVQLDSQATPFHSVRPAQDQAPCFSDIRRSRPFAASEGSFSDRSGIFGSPVICIGLYARLQGHLRRHLLQQILVHRRSRDVPTSGDQPDGKGDVPVPRVGAQRRSRHAQGIRGHDSQGLCRSRSIPYIYSTIDEEVDAATHRQPLRSPVACESVAVVRAAVSFATQTGTPSPKSHRGVYDTPYHPRYAITLVFTDILSVVGVSTHPTRHRGPHRQDRVGVVVARSRESRGHSHRSIKIKDVCLRFALRVVMQPYCSLLYSPRTVVLKTTLIVYSPPWYPRSLTDYLRTYLYPTLIVPWGGRHGVPLATDLLCFISHWASSHIHVVSIAAYKLFFRRHMYIIKNKIC